MSELVETRAIGLGLERLDGPEKVTGTARYAFEHPVADPLYLFPVQATIARGRVEAIDTAAARALDGVVAVLTHQNAPRLASDEDKELWVLQSDEVAFRGQFVGAVIAETSEIAWHAAGLVRAEYDEQPHDVELSADRDDLYAPELLEDFSEADTAEGDVEAALASAAVTLDETYTTPMEHNNPMEPHTTIAVWTDDGLTLYDSTQGVHWVRPAVAQVFGLEEERVRVVSPHVGGGFGSKAMPHAHLILVGLAAQMTVGRPVKLALTRQQMFSWWGTVPRRSRWYGSAQTPTAGCRL